MTSAAAGAAAGTARGPAHPVDVDAGESIDVEEAEDEENTVIGQLRIGPDGMLIVDEER